MNATVFHIESAKDIEYICLLPKEELEIQWIKYISLDAIYESMDSINKAFIEAGFPYMYELVISEDNRLYLSCAYSKSAYEAIDERVDAMRIEYQNEARFDHYQDQQRGLI